MILLETRNRLLFSCSNSPSWDIFQAFLEALLECFVLLKVMRAPNLIAVTCESRVMRYFIQHLGSLCAKCQGSLSQHGNFQMFWDYDSIQFGNLGSYFPNASWEHPIEEGRPFLSRDILKKLSRCTLAYSVCCWLVPSVLFLLELAILLYDAYFTVNTM